MERPQILDLVILGSSPSPGAIKKLNRKETEVLYLIGIPIFFIISSFCHIIYFKTERGKQYAEKHDYTHRFEPSIKEQMWYLVAVGSVTWPISGMVVIFGLLIFIIYFIAKLLVLGMEKVIDVVFFNKKSEPKIDEKNMKNTIDFIQELENKYNN